LRHPFGSASRSAEPFPDTDAAETKISAQLSIWSLAVRREDYEVRTADHNEREPQMAEYLILIYDNETSVDGGGPEVSDRLMKGHMEFGEKNAKAIRGGNALQPTTTATSIRTDGAGKQTVTDGPFAETKEALGGYYLVEAADLDEALAIAKQIPAISGGVEVRPVMVFD
jgi:hypothetical protein